MIRKYVIPYNTRLEAIGVALGLQPSIQTLTNKSLINLLYVSNRSILSKALNSMPKK